MKTRILLATFFPFACVALHAANVTVNLSGHVTQIDGNVPTGASVGDAVTFTAVYDVAAPDLNSDPARTLSFYSAGAAYINVDVHTAGGTLSFATGPAGSGDPMYAVTYDQTVYSPGDYFDLFGNNATGVNWPASLFLNSYNQLINSMYDFTAPFDLIDGVNLPPSGLPDLANVTLFNGEIRGSSNSGQSYDIHWNLDPIPEPSALALVVLGSVALFGFRLRNRARQS